MGNYSFELAQEPVLLAKHAAFPYQEEAIDFVCSRDFSAIFHEQGLGKTKIALDCGLRWLSQHDVDVVLIIAKKGLVGNWQREFATHTHIRPLVLSENSAHNYYVFTTPCRIVLAHYEAIKKEEKRVSAWLKTRRVAVFLDEAVKIKTPDTALTQSFFRLSSKFAKRVIMTGTPVANRPFDVWAPVFFLDGGATLGNDYAEFKRRTDLSKELRGNAALLEDYRETLSDIQKKLSEISVRETKAGGCIALPTKEFVRVDCQWEPGQLELYRQVKEELRAVVFRNGRLVEDDQESILKRLLRLIQIASNPKLVDQSYSAEPGKFPALYDLLTDIRHRGEKAIIFTVFNENSVWLTKKLAAFGTLCLNGSMPIERRNEVIKWFLENESDRVLVATTGAAKEGLTLTVANHVVFYDRTYSLDDYLQAQDRIHRVSQTRQCFVYTMVMRDSVDEWVEALLEQKYLAAKLTQGDISKEAYAAHADFSFFEILRSILNG